jgi:RNA polymerase sigma-70 factor (ECF subfamily)
MPEDSTTQLQACLDRLNAGDPVARDELIRRACERLRRLTARMLQDSPRLQRWEEADDVFQNATLRLLRALEAAPPASVQEFFGLAALQVRRELIDLARHYFGPEGLAALHASGGTDDSPNSTPPGGDPSTSTYQPERLAVWREFHEHVEALPIPEREVFGLLWYHGLTQDEAAQILNVSVATVKRRWLSARVLLQETLRGPPPT